MSGFVFMRVLESSAQRYDRGMRVMSRGRIGALYQRVAELAASPGCRVLDMGCGTGGVALACATRGAQVVGIDLNADMLDIARSKPLPFASRGSVDWLQIGIAEIEDRFEPASFDAVTACLLMSELSCEEQAYALAIAHRLLAPGGCLVLADEVLPGSWAQRFLYRIIRVPLTIATYAISQSTTRPVDNLTQMVHEEGFVEVLDDRPWPDVAIVTGIRPLAAA